jgi:hypothetical protein
MKHLPGFPVLKADVFSLKIGMEVYDKVSNRTGIISDIKDVGADNIAAFILLDGDAVELEAYRLPQTVIIGE